MLIACLFERWNYIKLHIRIFRLFSVAWVMIRPVLQICSAIVKISSELVKISSELIWFSSELIWFSSETFSTIEELLKISTLENTTVSEIGTPALCLNQQNRELLCFNFTEVSHPFISAIWVIVPFGEWSKNQMFSERFNAHLKNV